MDIEKWQNILSTIKSYAAPKQQKSPLIQKTHTVIRSGHSFQERYWIQENAPDALHKTVKHNLELHPELHKALEAGRADYASALDFATGHAPLATPLRLSGLLHVAGSLDRDAWKPFAVTGHWEKHKDEADWDAISGKVSAVGGFLRGLATKNAQKMAPADWDAVQAIARQQQTQIGSTPKDKYGALPSDLMHLYALGQALKPHADTLDGQSREILDAVQSIGAYMGNAAKTPNLAGITLYIPQGNPFMGAEGNKSVTSVIKIGDTQGDGLQLRRPSPSTVFASMPYQKSPEARQAANPGSITQLVITP